MEILFEFLAELLLQVIGEALVEFGLHSVAEPFRKRPDPWVAALGFFLIGGLMGALSLLVFHDHMIRSGAGRVANLVLTPVGAGLAMMAMGRWRSRRGDTVLRIDRFAYGFLMALGMALVRYRFAH